MSDRDVLGPAPSGVAAMVAAALHHMAPVFAVLRRVCPVLPLPGHYVVTRHDDVRAVFLNDPLFRVPYEPNLDVIMGGEKFFLGMDDTPEYRRDVAAMRAVILPGDLPALAAATETQAERILDASNGRVEVVEYTREITFSVLCKYFGVALPADGDLRVWATRLFQFQFTYGGKVDAATHDPLLDQARRMAPLLREHIDSLIAARRGAAGPDDVLGRCLVLQAAGEDGYTDARIRSALIGFLVGGLPQPPMVLPQAMEQLLQRGSELAGAIEAARGGDLARVSAYLFEALRFDPLAPFLQRKVVAPAPIGSGRWYERVAPMDTTILVSFASAMRDPRRVADPETFKLDRPACDYLHFGFHLHQCFGEQINRAMLPVMLQCLLRRGVRRAQTGGTLVKRGLFADALWVEF